MAAAAHRATRRLRASQRETALLIDRLEDEVADLEADERRLTQEARRLALSNRTEDARHQARELLAVQEERRSKMRTIADFRAAQRQTEGAFHADLLAQSLRAQAKVMTEIADRLEPGRVADMNKNLQRAQMRIETARDALTEASGTLSDTAKFDEADTDELLRSLVLAAAPSVPLRPRPGSPPRAPPVPLNDRT